MPQPGDLQRARDFLRERTAARRIRDPARRTRWRAPPGSPSSIRCSPRCARRGSGSSTICSSTTARAAGRCQRLLDAAARFASEHGAAGVMLETSRDNAPARALYRAAGWTRTRPSGTACASRPERSGSTMNAADPRTQARLAVERAPHDAMAWIMLSNTNWMPATHAPAKRPPSARCRCVPGIPKRSRALAARNGCRASAAKLSPACAPPPRMRRGIPASRCGWATYWKTLAKPRRRRCLRAAHALAPRRTADRRLPARVAAQALRLARPRCPLAQVRSASAAGRAMVEPFAFLSEDSTAAEQLQCARLRAAPLAQAIHPLPAAAARNAHGWCPRRIPFQWLRCASDRPAHRGAVRGIACRGWAVTRICLHSIATTAARPPAPARGHATARRRRDCRTPRSRGAFARPASTYCSICAAGAAVVRPKCWRCGRHRYR